MLDMILLDEVEGHNALLQAMLTEEAAALGEETVFHTAQTGEETVRIAGTVDGPAIYFLDIELGTEDNGIDAARRIHEQDPDGYIVYVSAYQQYAMDCLHSHVFDFLSKPVSSAELSACLKAILKDMKKTALPEEKKLMFSIGGQDYFILQRDITVIRSKRNFCETVISGQFYRWKEALKSVAERLDSGRFLQVNRNTAVNMDRVSGIDWTERRIQTDEGETVSFARSAAGTLQDWQRRAGR